MSEGYELGSTGAGRDAQVLRADEMYDGVQIEHCTR